MYSCGIKKEAAISTKIDNIKLFRSVNFRARYNALSHISGWIYT